MFTEGGQRLRGRELTVYGGKGGGSDSSSQTSPYTTVLTDPVSGKSFTSYSTGNAMYDAMLGYNTSGTTEQEQLNAAITAREAEEAKTSAATTAAATQKAAEEQSTFQTRKKSAYDNAMQSVMQAFQRQGVDPNQYLASEITPALEYQQGTIQDLDPAPQSAYPTNLGETIVNNALSGKRTQSLNALNNIFTPTYTEEQLPYSLAQPYVEQSLASQFDPLSQQLTNAQKRNMLTGTGYEAANRALGTSREGARSTVTSLGQGILDADRSGLNDYISGARSNVNNMTLGATFDPNTYSTAAQGKVQGYKDVLGGALTNAIGDTRFADISGLINAGGAAQGSQNPNQPAVSGAAGGTSPGALAAEEQARQPRGLGNVGAF